MKLEPLSYVPFDISRLIQKDKDAKNLILSSN